MNSLFLTIVLLGFYPAPPALAASIVDTPTIVFSSTTAEDIIESYAVHYGIEAETFKKTLYCESSYNPNAWNKSDPNGGSKGIAQFQESTFKRYAPLAGITKPDIWNPLQQIQTAAYMFSKGEQGQWSCFAKVTGANAPPKQ